MRNLLVGVAAVCILLVGLPADASAQTAPRITLLNEVTVGSPADVYVNGDLIYKGFQPGTFLDLSAYVGQTITLDLRRTERYGGATGPRDVSLPVTGNWTLVQYVTFYSPNSFTYVLGLSTFENPTTPVGQGNGVFVVRNTLQGFGSVSVSAGDDSLMSGIGQGQQASVVLPAGRLSNLRFFNQNGGEFPAPVATVDIMPGTTLILYLNGRTQRVTHATLPRTGAKSTGTQAVAGASLVVAGLALIAASRRRIVPS